VLPCESRCHLAAVGAVGVSSPVAPVGVFSVDLASGNAVLQWEQELKVNPKPYYYYYYYYYLELNHTSPVVLKLNVHSSPVKSHKIQNSPVDSHNNPKQPGDCFLNPKP
jgi:hypothetical protein